MKNSEVPEVLAILMGVRKVHAKLAYAIAKQRPALITLQKEVSERQKDAYDERSKKYISDRDSLIESFAVRDANGNPTRTKDGRGFEIGDGKGLKDAVNAFDEERKDDKDYFDTQSRVLSEFLESDAEIQKYKIEESWLPGFRKDADGKVIEEDCEPAVLWAILEVCEP